MSETATANEFESFGYSSEDVRPVDRIPLYRDLLGRWLVRMDFQPVGGPFRRKARVVRFPGLNVYYVEGSDSRLGWAGVNVEEGFALGVLVGQQGTATLTHVGREATISGGGAVLISTADPARMELSRACFAVIGVPREVLAPMLANPDTALMRAIPGTIEPLRLLGGYLPLLIGHPTPLEDAELRRLTADHVHDLVALALGATRDAAEIAAGRGLRAARMRAIKGDIAQNLTEDVSAAALSARRRVSARYIRKLFEGENTSLSQFVLGERLTRVRRLLTDPRHANRTISEIALAVGFGDVSTFNREFRRRFGKTPSEVRIAARRGVTPNGHDLRLER